MTNRASTTVISLEKVADWVEDGKRLFALGLYEQALMEFGKALQIKPDDLDTWVWQAATLTHLDDFTAALGSLERALKYASPQHDSKYDLASIYLFRGIVLRGLEQHRKAYLSFDRALKFQQKQGRSFWQMLVRPLLAEGSGSTREDFAGLWKN